jgi:predicted alpha/beta hydrolase family esterase
VRGQTKVVIVHGTLGHPRENWFPWLASALRDLGHQVVVPTLPTPVGQSLTGWLRAFDRQVGALRSDSILVGHSLGAAFALRILERQREPIARTRLVSAFEGALGLPQFDPWNASFFEEPFDWEQIKARAGQLTVYHGDDDPYVPLSKASAIADRLCSAVVVVSGGGHLNAAAGYTRFDLLLTDLIDVLKPR